MGKMRTFIAALAFSLVIATAVHAAPITLGASDSGAYTNFGGHDSTETNYIAGDLAGVVQFRNFFVFNLGAGLGDVASAKLRLNTSTSTADSSRIYTLYDVLTSVSTLVTAHPDALPLDPSIYADLGSGVSYGSRTGPFPSNSVIDVDLSAAAITALGAASGMFAFGGALDEPLDVGQNLFGDFVTFFNPQLIYELAEIEEEPSVVPEPATLAMWGVGAFGLAFARRRKLRAA